MFKLPIAILLCAIISSNALPVSIHCNENENPSQGYTCWLNLTKDTMKTIAKMPLPISEDYQEAFKRNAELSSALSSLYGYGKRNPELSSALMSYLNRDNIRH
ncbi:unnamed protein product [Phyllotreta striolata]|uniref:Uncharacterized protein n=1 Tax=Phyllotreta striolata TaxID=444603 RepID=A0A9N9TE82_PHYSR|nr:unnamed protein product [Phyllotreta striolata]